MNYKGTHKSLNIKSFKYNPCSSSGRSIVENFLSSGLLPGYTATLSLIAKCSGNVKDKTHLREFSEFERKIKGTEVTTKVKIYRIKNLRVDCSLEDLKRFESLAASNNWSDEAMAAIYVDMIDDPRYDSKLSNTSYRVLREQILGALFPKSEGRLFISKLEKVKQEDYFSINDYYFKLEELVGVVTNIFGLTQKESERRDCDAFHRGLGNFSSIEIFKQGIDCESVQGMLEYFNKLEEGILLQASLKDLKLERKNFNEKEGEIRAAGYVPIQKKWCSIHKMKSHYTKDCYLNRNSNKAKDELSGEVVKNADFKRSLLINEGKNEIFKTVEIQGNVADSFENFTIDSGSDINYVNKNVVERLKLSVLEGEPINLVFGDGTKEKTRKKVSEEVTFNGIKYTVEFYVLNSVPADFILGNEFLINNDCTLCYSKRILTINDRNVITLNNSEKTTDEILGERLSDRIDFSSVPDRLSRCLYTTEEISLKANYRHLIEKYSLKNANGAIVKDKKDRITINLKYVDDFLKQVHCLSGHRGISITYYNLKNYIYIKNIFKRIIQIVKGCYTCIRVKPKIYKKNKENYILAIKKFERISTDIYGPFNTEGFQCNFVGETGYILSVTDIFSRFTRLYLFEKIKSGDVIGAIKSWIHEFEKPNFVISDNGLQFSNKIVAHFFSHEGIKQILVPEYTPSSNEISERLNQTITFILSINKGKLLADTIKKAENTINLNYNRTLGSSPMAVCKNVDFYDYLGLYKNKFKPKRKKPFKKSVKIGDLVYKRNFNTGKLDPVYETNLREVIKVGKKGFWVKLSNAVGWTHVKNIKVVKEGSMWY